MVTIGQIMVANFLWKFGQEWPHGQYGPPGQVILLAVRWWPIRAVLIRLLVCALGPRTIRPIRAAIAIESERGATAREHGATAHTSQHEQRTGGQTLKLPAPCFRGQEHVTATF